MKYEHVERKMPGSLKESILRQPWCSALRTLGDSLEEILTPPTHLAELYRELTSDEKSTLRLVMSTFGCLPFTSERLAKEAVLQMAGAQVSLGLWGLRRYGIIVAFRKSWGEQLYTLPEDAFAGWQSLLFPILWPPEQSDLEELRDLSDCIADMEEDSVPSNPRGLAQQLFHCMVSCSRQSELSLTNKGTLHKKQLQKITEHVRLPARILTQSGLTYAFTDVYDEPAALMLELGMRMGFLYKNETGNRFLFHHRRFERWLQSSYEYQQAQLYRIWRQALIPAPVWLEHGIACMERATVLQWYSVSELLQAILTYCSITHKPVDDEALRQELMIAWIKPLSTFRFVELAEDQEGQRWFRWLITPRLSIGEGPDSLLEQSHRNDPSLYVQPDFEVLLPPNASLRLEWGVAAFADLQNADLVRTYRLTKESFGRALDHGLRSSDVIQVLRDHAYYEVPEGVVITLQQWEEQKDKLYLTDVTLLRCQSNEVAEALLRNEKCSNLLGERLGETNFIVSREHVKHLTKCLEAMGFHPNPNQIPNLLSDEEGEIPSWDEPVLGLCYSKDTIQLYEIDPYLPQREELYPDMQQIPVSWIKELRDYHASTRKDMIRKAIEWKSVLQLRKEGRDCFIIPRMLREDRTGWILEGWEEYEEIAWTGEDWKEMKLILPGINDGSVREKEETLGEL
ncbi:helicase-associated domain-containing protein [Paenibacillus qinlingensis]|uniref:helicase-associated domain-containing protein n=1 Tax=Paenibacillus qinlingensis TaxID=1837343 RepID=UPI00156542F5|nr:helicase-associated domain-containing protein [Paenibacillus qinlingensis]NQX57494.1 helicase-associated domain-containing protein [Paenibacillus qinlingensis]